VVISSSSGGRMSYGDYLGIEAQPAVLPEGEITTGSVIKYYGGGSLESFTIVKFGDIDTDGGFDGRDSVFVTCIINGLIDESALSPAQFRAADCNSDGQIDEEDYNLLISAGLLLQTVDQNISI
ncbi:MAG: hypothetical protein IJU45_04235, partial [Clostridia bacterium]|nr:hypothetical protein [Clostridia bacterium]